MAIFELVEEGYEIDEDGAYAEVASGEPTSNQDLKAEGEESESTMPSLI